MRHAKSQAQHKERTAACGALVEPRIYKKFFEICHSTALRGAAKNHLEHLRIYTAPGTFSMMPLLSTTSALFSLVVGWWSVECMKTDILPWAKCPICLLGRCGRTYLPFPLGCYFSPTKSATTRCRSFNAVLKAVASLPILIPIRYYRDDTRSDPNFVPPEFSYGWFFMSDYFVWMPLSICQNISKGTC